MRFSWKAARAGHLEHTSEPGGSIKVEFALVLKKICGQAEPAANRREGKVVDVERTPDEWGRKWLAWAYLPTAESLTYLSLTPSTNIHVHVSRQKLAHN